MAKMNERWRREALEAWKKSQYYDNIRSRDRFLEGWHARAVLDSKSAEPKMKCHYLGDCDMWAEDLDGLVVLVECSHGDRLFSGSTICADCGAVIPEPHDPVTILPEVCQDCKEEFNAADSECVGCPDLPAKPSPPEPVECDERGSVKLDTLKEVKAPHDGVGLILGHELRKLAKAVVHYETLDFVKSQYIALRMRLIADHIAPPKAEVQAPHKKVTHIDYTGEIR